MRRSNTILLIAVVGFLALVLAYAIYMGVSVKQLLHEEGVIVLRQSLPLLTAA